MSSPYLALENISYQRADGRMIFSDLSMQFDTRPTGLVGRNGIGKSLLAQILSGRLAPTGGHCYDSGRVYYLAQQMGPQNAMCVADLAGVAPILNALMRIESGSTCVADFDAVGDHWDIRQWLDDELARNGLGYLSADTPADQLSGGEAMRVSLMGAMHSGADFLLLDEPSNHLDRASRQALIAQLQDWSGGLIVISHDRQLLKFMQRIVALSAHGLRSYGGDYDFYADALAQERARARQHLAEHKLERQRQERAMRQQRDRQTSAQARGNRLGKTANQAKVLLGRQKARCEKTSGIVQQKLAENLDKLNRRVREAAHKVAHESEIVLHKIPEPARVKRRVVELDEVVLPHVGDAARRISLILRARQRVGIVGPNGCGKSTLLRVFAGEIAPLGGTCKVVSERAYLDQRLGCLDLEKTIFEQLKKVNRSDTDGDLRMRLAGLGLDAQKMSVSCGSLSGGERLKGALACVLYADAPVQLLLLDEPNNHLDLPSLQALERMLCSYHGALLVVAHDDLFLNNLALTEQLSVDERGWRIQPL